MPILVELLTREQALLIACRSCSWEKTIAPEDLRNERDYLCAACGAPADFKYEEADKCGGCGDLGFFAPELNGCCSRVCMLQAEYAKTLAARRRASACS